MRNRAVVFLIILISFQNIYSMRTDNGENKIFSTDDFFDDNFDYSIAYRGTNQDGGIFKEINEYIDETVPLIESAINETKSIEEIGPEQVIQISTKFAHILRHILPQENQSEDLVNHVVANTFSRGTINGLVVPILGMLDASTITNHGFITGMLNPLLYELNPSLASIFSHRYEIPMEIKSVYNVNEFSKFTDHVFCHVGHNIANGERPAIPLAGIVKNMFPSFNSSLNDYEIGVLNKVSNAVGRFNGINQIRNDFLDQIHPSICKGLKVPNGGGLFFQGFEQSTGYPVFEKFMKTLPQGQGQLSKINTSRIGVISGISESDIQKNETSCNWDKFKGAKENALAFGGLAVAGAQAFKFTREGKIGAGIIGTIAGGIYGWNEASNTSDHCIAQAKKSEDEFRSKSTQSTDPRREMNDCHCQSAPKHDQYKHEWRDNVKNDWRPGDGQKNDQKNESNTKNKNPLPLSEDKSQKEKVKEPKLNPKTDDKTPNDKEKEKDNQKDKQDMKNEKKKDDKKSGCEANPDLVNAHPLIGDYPDKEDDGNNKYIRTSGTELDICPSSDKHFGIFLKKPIEEENSEKDFMYNEDSFDFYGVKKCGNDIKELINGELLRKNPFEYRHQDGLDICPSIKRF